MSKVQEKMEKKMFHIYTAVQVRKTQRLHLMVALYVIAASGAEGLTEEHLHYWQHMHLGAL
jgi:hypothetical protein